MSVLNPTKVIIPCRISYAHLFEPTSVNGSDPKYGASLIVSKKDAKTITAIQKAIEQAKKDSVGKWGGKVPPNLKTPLRDGDTDRPDDEAYAGSFFLNANSRQAPRWWTARCSPSSTRARCTPAATAMSASPSTATTATATAASPPVWAMSSS